MSDCGLHGASGLFIKICHLRIITFYVYYEMFLCQRPENVILNSLLSDNCIYVTLLFLQIVMGNQFKIIINYR